MIETGGGTGIGRAISIGFAREGASMIVDYVGDESRQPRASTRSRLSVRRAFAGRGGRQQVGEFDDLMSRTVEHFGGIDILVNNAGIEYKVPFLKRR